VLGLARVAVDTSRLVADQGFDSVRQNHFALAAPGINIAAELPRFSFHSFHAEENTAL
jgi:hypothetical protein